MRKTVLVDLDGVLADYTSGWRGIDHIGDPIPGAVEFTRHLAEFARVVIYTTRCKAYLETAPGPDGVPEPDRNDPERLAGIVKVWLDRHGFTYDEVYTGQGKPFAAAIIDDRAVVCRPQSPYAGMRDERDPDEFTKALWAARNFCE
jgi:phosphoglycolate phosphatase-like HAD superfamily hydrolase